MNTKRVTVNFPSDTHRAIRVKAAALCLSVADVVRDLLRRWLAGELKTEVEGGDKPA